MKITDVTVTTVALPLEAKLRHSSGVHSFFTRNILQMYTDDGLTGLSEVSYLIGEQQIREAKAVLCGEDPFNLERIRTRILFQGHRMLQGQGLPLSILYGALEIALLDLQGKAIGRPIHQVLGGKLRDHVDVAAYLFYRYGDDRGEGAVTHPDEMVAHARELVDRYGFATIKLKGGVLPPNHDVAVMRALRAAFPTAELRLDPNSVWALETALRVAAQVKELDLEYLEDPTWGIAAMADVTQRSGIPTATNMCVVQFDQLPAAVAHRAPTIILADLWYWAGATGVKQLAAMCSTFKLGLGMHSGTETGIGLMAMAHCAATLPNLVHALDTHYHHLQDDVVTGGIIPIQDGKLMVPDRPGLGVELDPERLEQYHAYYKESGLVPAHGYDPVRSAWFQRPPIW